jgi:hypothetical protein
MPKLLWSLTMTLMGAGYFNTLVEESLKEIKDGTGEIGENAGELLEEKLREQLSESIENYNTSKNELHYFKEELAKLVSDLSEPLVFIVDELDRCKPEFSIKMIERIKHFFDIPNIVFVLATNKTQLEESINSFYGFKSENCYLEKFIDLNIKFPIKEENGYNEVIIKYIKLYDLNLNSKDLILMAKLFNLNYRDLIRILQKIALMNNLNTIASPIIVFLYLAMDQKSMNPSSKNQKEFFDIFIKLLIEHTKYRPSFSHNQYNFENLAEFADQYGENFGDHSGLPYLLKYYYLEYSGEAFDQYKIDLKDKLKRTLMANNSHTGAELIKSWSNYINSGFIIE